jgi:hypothetical protein
MSLPLPQIQYIEGWKHLLLIKDEKMTRESIMEVLKGLHQEQN